MTPILWSVRLTRREYAIFTGLLVTKNVTYIERFSADRVSLGVRNAKEICQSNSDSGLGAH